MQDGIVITENRIRGTLKYIDDYTDFSGNPDLQKGHYLALKFAGAPDGAVTTVQLIGAVDNPNPVVLDSDMIALVRIVNPATQKLKVVCTADDYQTYEHVYKLSGLVLEPEE